MARSAGRREGGQRLRTLGSVEKLEREEEKRRRWCDQEQMGK